MREKARVKHTPRIILHAYSNGPGPTRSLNNAQILKCGLNLFAPLRSNSSMAAEEDSDYDFVAIGVACDGDDSSCDVSIANDDDRADALPPQRQFVGHCDDNCQMPEDISSENARACWCILEFAAPILRSFRDTQQQPHTLVRRMLAYASDCSGCEAPVFAFDALSSMLGDEFGLQLAGLEHLTSSEGMDRVVHMIHMLLALASSRCMTYDNV